MGWYQPAENVVRPILEPMCHVEAFLGLFYDLKCLNALPKVTYNHKGTTNRKYLVCTSDQIFQQVKLAVVAAGQLMALVLQLEY